MKNISLIGAGGMAKEIISWMKKSYMPIEYLYDGLIDEEKYVNNCLVSNKFRESRFHTIAVGYPETKVKIISNIKYFIKWSDAIIHNSAMVGNNVNIGLGSIVYPFSVFTADISIGPLASINTFVTIGHDCKIGEMFHACPGATISGNVTIGDRVFLGANSCIKEEISVCDDVIIGAGSVVVKDINFPGTYAGNPARKI